ncbi:hypothetical protein PPYR_14606 [Photinus pyralis]|uniref:Uncharacterized protein n=1 Tax=Photinus pyralis TaxID=7054 RepID=A0A5N4A5R1_PHOPY|nr:phenoloxidase-activating factor 3-like [Photinus pyralis]KAB0792647.1 hypothetical protein PPYR_14606 [Photinus pyralis]
MGIMPSSFLVLAAFFFAATYSDMIDIRITEDCTTPNGDKGKCKLLEDCPHAVSLFANPSKEIVNYMQGFLCKFSDPALPGAAICCTEPPPKRAVIPDKRYCGFQHSDDLMLDIRKTSIIEFPWLSAIMKKDQGGEDVVTCLGTLITNRYVLTSGFCAEKTGTWVRLGEFYVKNKTDCETWKSELNDCNQHEDFQIEEAVPHPFINTGISSLNDIGLLRLEKSVSYSDYIRPICLPSPTEKVEVQFFTSGWDDSQLKIKIPSTLASDRECLGEGSALSKYSKCVRYQNVEGGRESCHVINNGAPIMASAKYQWYLEGVSHMFYQKNGSCFAKFTPIVPYMDWIKNNLRS